MSISLPASIYLTYLTNTLINYKITILIYSLGSVDLFPFLWPDSSWPLIMWVLFIPFCPFRRSSWPGWLDLMRCFFINRLFCCTSTAIFRSWLLSPPPLLHGWSTHPLSSKDCSTPPIEHGCKTSLSNWFAFWTPDLPVCGFPSP